MPPQFRALLTRLASYAGGFSAAQKTLALLAVAGLVLGTVALSTWLGKPTMSPLFSGLQAADASRVTDQLKAGGVSYEITDGGGTIMVPQDKVYAERIKAAAAGLPSDKSSAGYSLLDNMGVTSSEFQQNITYQRAMEGELASTISAMNGVKLATVKLAIPKDSVFTATKADPTASVFIETKPGAALSADQVQAIVHLTSASIDGLKPGNVAVIDSAGITLSAVGTGLAGSSVKQANDYEKTLTGNVQAMLDKVLGPGNATVAITADMDAQSGTKVDETFNAPENAPALAESSDTQSYTGTGGAGAGVLGRDNIASPGGTSGEGTFTQEKATRNNAVNKTTQTTTIPAGLLKRQTVSVAMNAAAGANVAQIRSLVAAAAGIDPARGDVVTVENVTFNQADEQAAREALAAAKAAEDTKAVRELWWNIVGGLSVLLLALLAMLLYARKNRRQKREIVDLGERVEPPLPLDPGPATTVTGVPALPVQAPVPVQMAILPLPEGNSGVAQKRAHIETMMANDPDKAVAFLRGLMDRRERI